MSIGYLVTGKKDECYGCEACVQVCAHSALHLVEDEEGFRYPLVNKDKCVNCGLCNKVCPVEHPLEKETDEQIAFGGYAKDSQIRENSTSGGAFSAIVDRWCSGGGENYAVFGALADGLEVRHSYVVDKSLISPFRKSKYSQSEIGDAFKKVRCFLKEEYSVLFSGTPCQIGALLNYLRLYRTSTEKLLTVEVVCEGVPSPLYVRKLNEFFLRKYKTPISTIDYRNKDNMRWDFEVMEVGFKRVKTGFFNSFGLSGCKVSNKTDRWFNPFWSIWLQHLMSRPSCYKCAYATKSRVADITLGDLWGVHIYCPELYGNNGGSSVVGANTVKGREVVAGIQQSMVGHELDMDDVVRFQGPMRRPVSENPRREECMADLQNPLKKYEEINCRWAKSPSLKLLFNKYIWGNRQKVALWNIKQSFGRK